MSRTEADREDLFAEAVALRRRVELTAPGLPAAANPVVAGFHADGRAGVYCGGNSADHFDPAGRLARAFRTANNGEPVLYRSQGATLAELVRRREAGRTVLSRRDLPADELAAFLAATRDRLRAVAAALTDGPPTRTAGDDPRADLAAFLLAAVPADGPLAPRYKGKR